MIMNRFGYEYEIRSLPIVPQNTARERKQINRKLNQLSRSASMDNKASKIYTNGIFVILHFLRGIKWTACGSLWLMGMQRSLAEKCSREKREFRPFSKI